MLELRHCRPAFFEFRRVVHGPMDLVKINGFGLQAAQAVFTLAANRISLQQVMDFPLSIPTQTTFGEDIRTRTVPTRQGAGHHFFRVAGAIDRRGINPVDSQFQCAMNRRDGRVVILITPCELPTGAANGPSPEAHRRDEQIRIAELFRFHVIKCFCFHDVFLFFLLCVPNSQGPNPTDYCFNVSCHPPPSAFTRVTAATSCRPRSWVALNSTFSTVLSAVATSR